MTPDSKFVESEKSFDPVADAIGKRRVNTMNTTTLFMFTPKGEA
tara:strand:- start:92 stop:223 length:132 start_codon:yes stop_codon:yes gene_type:complete